MVAVVPSTFVSETLEPLIVRVRAVLQITERDRLAQLDRRISIAPPMNSGMNPMAEADVMGELMQFSVDGEFRFTGQAQSRRWRWPRHWTEQARRASEFEGSIVEELEGGDARAGDRAVPGGIGRMGRRALGKSLRKQIAVMS